MRHLTTLREVYPNWMANEGVFDKLTEAPWYVDGIDSLMNLEYFGNHSGQKVVAPLVRALLEDGELTDSSRESLAKVISARFMSKWNAIWEAIALSLEYNPIAKNVSHETVYGKVSTDSGDETLTYSGQEQNSRTRGITTSYAGKEHNDESGTTEFDRNPTGTVTRGISGGWSDADSTATTRTGSQIDTNGGKVQSNVYGFDTAVENGVPSALELPTNTLESTFNNIKDTNSGSVTRSYNQYVETTTDTFKPDETTTHGKKLTKSFEDRQDTTNETVTDTKQFTQRNDTTDFGKVVTLSGSDVTTDAGYDEPAIDPLTRLVENQTVLDFFQIVYADVDAVLALSVWQ